MTHYVIIGDGGAGTTAAYFIRKADPLARIEIYSEDPNSAYYRAALTNYLIGELREAQLFAIPPDFYFTNKIQRALGRVVAVDSGNSKLTLAHGSEIPYDQLLIAAGASPNPPIFPGAELPGVMTMRTLQDARTVMDLVSSKRLRQAIVVGGGPLGIEWVQGLLHHNVKVIYLLRGDMFFERALDRTASDLVISRLRAEGVDMRLNEEIDQGIAGTDGKLRAIRLKNSGEVVECQLVGAAIGIRPNVDFLNGSGIDVAIDQKRGTAQGIKVNEYMRTNIPNVYAAGDILYRTLGLWEPARLQGRVAGRNMAGGSEVFHSGVHYNATRLFDLDFAGVGDITEKSGDQILVDFPKGSGRVAYRKLIVRGNKLVGAIMLGQRKERIRKYGMHYRNLIDKQIDISSVSNKLLDSSFDLAGWMDTDEIRDEIDSARRITIQPSSPSIAKMRTTNSVLNVDVSSQLAEIPKMASAMLKLGDSNIPLKEVMRIGRKSENDLVLNDPNVSGEHARIRWDVNVFVLEDLKSRNGTFLNGLMINAPSPLSDGALIRMGDTELRFTQVLPTENPKLTSVGLPEAAIAPPALTTDPIWGTLQIGEREIPLRLLAVNIGRDTSAEIVLNDETISYLHAQIVRQGSDSYLRDLGSHNGTYVNGVQVSVPHLLENGDRLQLGETSLIFRVGSPTGVIARADVPASSQSPTLPEKPVIVTPIELALTVISGSIIGQSFHLNKSPMTIGRDPASQIVLSDQTTSWHHATFIKEDKQWFIKDLGSSNGILLNQKKLEPNKLYPLQVTDQLRFGETILEVAPHAS